MQAITVLLPALAEVLAAEDWDAINRLGRNLPRSQCSRGRGEQAREFNALFNTHIAQVLALILQFQNTRGNRLTKVL